MKTLILSLSLLFSTQLMASGQHHGVSYTPDETQAKLVPAVVNNDREQMIEKMIQFNAIQVQHDQNGEYIYNLTECMQAFLRDENTDNICIILNK